MILNDDIISDILVTLLAQEDPEPVNGARARPGAVTTAQPQRVRFFEISSPHICPRFLNAVVDDGKLEGATWCCEEAGWKDCRWEGVGD